MGQLQERVDVRRGRAEPRLCGLDDVHLAVFSMGIPIGLGIYLAWVDRDRPTRFGLAWAVVGALAGAWLGFHAGSSLMAVVTTTVGAAAGANLALLGLDIRRDRFARATAPAEAAPSVALPA